MAYLVELTQPRVVGIRTYATPDIGADEVLVERCTPASPPAAS